MLSKLFKQKAKAKSPLSPPIKVETNIQPHKTLSIEQQKIQHKQRRTSVIDEFGKSIINFLQADDIWTPLHIIDFLEVDFSQGYDIPETILNDLEKSQEIHKQNLRQTYYKKSLNFQPSYLLLVVKEQKNNTITSFKNNQNNLNSLVNILKPDLHRLLLVRYFVPPIPDDLHKFDDVVLPEKFQETVKNIINYIDINYSLDNLNFKKWETLIIALHDLDVRLNFPQNAEEVTLTEMLTTDYSHLNYEELMVKQVLSEKVEKNPISIPLFILLLAFFCSEESAKSVFSYHYLFDSTGHAKKRSMNRGDISFPKLFNQLLDESLLPKQFSKCLSIIYNETFRFKETEINDLFLVFREKSALKQ
ncbi:hypothetical protein [Crocosphaera sp. XPORK-15E]|uniref:hypothetical protein n=1 Tax=Crocosphaera sp. XPORK-15E TaxID=3110247 RepID=UPI002B21BB12|nr:hypothetical protein [Crocosphaera sp. XPORK-15E]